jgi:phosphoribosyl 1,2-cyclic phosphodiesterase
MIVTRTQKVRMSLIPCNISSEACAAQRFVLPATDYPHEGTQSERYLDRAGTLGYMSSVLLFECIHADFLLVLFCAVVL